MAGNYQQFEQIATLFCIGSRAIRLIPKVLAIVDLQKDFHPGSSIMQVIISTSDPTDLYRSLPQLLRRVDKETCKAFIDLLHAIVPARWVFSHKQWFVYLGLNLTGEALVIANTDSNLRPLLPSASSATFAEAESRVMRATA